MPQEAPANNVLIGDQPQQIKPAPRLRELDLLRGFTLLMILSVNVGVYLSDNGGSAENRKPPTSAVDFLASIFTSITPLRSYLIFSFVFGYGFIIWLTQRHVDRPIMRRRTLGLIGIGIVHGLLLFEFDILLTYGVFGYLLYKLYPRLTDRRLLKGAAIIIGSTTVITFAVLSGILIYQNGAVSLGDGGNESYRDLANGPLGPWISARLTVWWDAQISIAMTQWWGVVTMFLLGAYAGRNNLLTASEQRNKLMRKILQWGGPITSAVILGTLLWQLNSGSLLSNTDAANNKIGPEILLLVFVPALSVISSLTYIAAFVWLGAKIFDTPLGKGVAAAGSMSLTGYMTQSLVLMLVFTWPGLGLASKVAPGWAYLAIVAFWMVQCFLAPRWLTRYRLGPDEWVLRYVTYGKRPQFRR